jgi:hypothetical protein
MTKWEQFEMERKITEVLSMAKFETEHHFGRPFLTPYQIAIELNSRHPTLCKDLEMELGGAGTGLQNSLTQYIAQQLSTRIKKGTIRNIKGIFISNMHLIDLGFKTTTGREIHSSNIDQDTLSMFRLR